MTNINTFQGDVFIHEYIKHTGDDNNLFGFSGTDTFKIATGGTDRLVVGSDGNVTITNAIIIPDYIYHTGDLNNLFGFSGTDTFKIATGGTDRLTINSSGTVTIAGTLTAGGFSGNDISTGTVAAARVANLNQNTTGSAATLTTSRTIGGVSFNGSGNITPTTFGAASFTGGTETQLRLSPTAGLGNKSGIRMYASFASGTADTTPRRSADILTGFSTLAWGNEFMAFHVGKGGATNDGQNLTIERMRIAGNGTLGLGTTNPGYKLHVNGSLFYSSGGLNGSDDRIKYNEENITNALDIICKLKPQKYEKIMAFPSDATGSWIPTDENWETVKNAETKPWEGFTHGDEYGFIAQDVRNIPEVSFLVSGSEMKTVDESVSPEEYVNLNEDEQGTYTRKYVYEENVITIEEYTNLISENKDKCTGIYIKQVETQTPLGLNYQGIFVVAVKAIQEIDAQLQAEKVRNDALEARILALESA